MNRTPILIDCDTGIDDLISFVLTLSSDRLDIRGVTTVAGNVSLKHTTYNTLNGLALMGRGDIPVAAGESAPLERPYRDASQIHGDSGLGGFTFENPVDYGPIELTAVEFLYERLMKSEEKITILALAPLTNIAKLLLAHPDCREKIDRIVFMGGSIFSGNPTPVATFNVWVDPEAARIVMKSGVPFHMCPLDTTREAYLTEEELEPIGAMEHNPVAAMVYSLCSFYWNREKKNVNGKKRFKGLCIHDLCTAAYVTNPELFETVKYYGDVETKGELTEGFTMIDYEDILHKTEEEKNIVYIRSVDRAGVMKVFFEALESYGGKV